MKSVRDMSLSSKLVAVFAVPALGFAAVSWSAITSHMDEQADISLAAEQIELHRALRTAAIAVGSERLVAAELAQLPGGVQEEAEGLDLEAAQTETDAALSAVAAINGGKPPIIALNALTQATESVDRARRSSLRQSEVYTNASIELLNGRSPLSTETPTSAAGSNRAINLVADMVEATDDAWISFAERGGTDTRSAVAIGSALGQADQLRTAVSRNVGGAVAAPVDLALENTAVMPRYAIRATEDLLNTEESVILGSDALATLKDSRRLWLNAVNDAEQITVGELNRAASDASGRRNRTLAISGVTAILLALGARYIFGMTAGTIRSLTRRTEDITLHNLPELLAGDPFGQKVALPDGELPEALDRPDDHELGDLSTAVSELHAAAFAAAINQKLSRQNTAQAFVAIQRRSQRVVDQLLNQLGQLQNSEEDQERLTALRSASHLVQRLRHTNESGLVIAGVPTPRVWAYPIPIEVAVRAALSETFSYERIHISALPAVGIRGDAATDLAHILAELFDNGTKFSQAPTVVDLSSRIEGHSLVLTITDRGNGMTEDELAAANIKLNTNPTWEQVDPNFLGLFIAGRLAEQQGISIKLLEGVEGGTSARVTLGPEVIREVGAATNNPGQAAALGHPSSGASQPSPAPQQVSPESGTGTKPSTPSQQHPLKPSVPVPGTLVPPVPANLRRS